MPWRRVRGLVGLVGLGSHVRAPTAAPHCVPVSLGGLIATLPEVPRGDADLAVDTRSSQGFPGTDCAAVVPAMQRAGVDDQLEIGIDRLSLHSGWLGVLLVPTISIAEAVPRSSVCVGRPGLAATGGVVRWPRLGREHLALLARQRFAQPVSQQASKKPSTRC